MKSFPMSTRGMISRAMGEGGQGGSSFSPLDLPGLVAWYDPSDLTTLFQDAAGTIPVTADGDPVGLMLDKSGNGHHASQAVSANRPVYRTAGGLSWIETNGVNQSMSTPLVDLTHTDELFVGFGVTMLVSASAILLEFSPDTNSNSGSNLTVFDLDNTYSNNTKGTIYSTATAAKTAAVTPPDTCVLTANGKIGGSYLNTIRRNQVQTAASSSLKGTGNLGNYSFYLFARNGASFFAESNLYQMVICSALTTGSELTNLEKFIAKKSGATL